MISGITYDRVEAAPKDRPLARENGKCIRTAHLYRSVVYLISIKDTFLRRNSIMTRIIPTDQNIDICTAGGRVECGSVVLSGLVRGYIAVDAVWGIEREAGV